MEPKYEVGDRFEDKDTRSAGRIVQVRKVYAEVGLPIEYRCEVEVHPKNPEVVGRETLISEKTLARRYRKISR